MVMANWSEIESGGSKSGKKEFPLIPEGWYPFLVKNNVIKPWSKEGKEYGMWNPTLVIVDGPNKNRHLWVRLYLSPEAMRFFKWFVSDCGLDLEDGYDVQPEEVIGKLIGCHITHETGNDGKVREKIDEYCRIEELSRKTERTTAKTPEPVAAPMKDEDVPF